MSLSSDNKVNSTYYASAATSANNNIVLTDKKRLLIIGYGVAGSQITAHLAKNNNCNITVVTPFDYMEISLSLTKVTGAKYEEDFHKDALFPLLEEPNVNYIIASCKSLSGNLAVLSNNDEINFDACIIWLERNNFYY
jgi:NADH dehydrogenase FAD-containing subunit